MERNQSSRDFESETQLVLGLDAGQARCGVARADASRTLASPLAVVPTQPLATLAARVAALLDGAMVALLVAGLPLDQHGNEGPSCQLARQVAEALAQGLGCQLEFVDERFTTRFAERSRRAVRPGARDTKFDDWAAAAILQAYLDRPG